MCCMRLSLPCVLKGASWSACASVPASRSLLLSLPCGRRMCPARRCGCAHVRLHDERVRPLVLECCRYAIHPLPQDAYHAECSDRAGGQRLGTSMMVCRRMVHQRIRCGAAVSRNVELLCKDLLGSQSWSMNPMWEYFLPKHACGAACAPKRSCRCASEGLTVRVPCPSTLRCLADRRGCRRRTSLPVSVVTSRLSRLLGRESLRGDILWSIQNAFVT